MSTSVGKVAAAAEETDRDGTANSCCGQGRAPFQSDLSRVDHPVTQAGTFHRNMTQPMRASLLRRERQGWSRAMTRGKWDQYE
jgi:hypothetical protein